DGYEGGVGQGHPEGGVAGVAPRAPLLRVGPGILLGLAAGLPPLRAARPGADPAVQAQARQRQVTRLARDLGETRVVAHVVEVVILAKEVRLVEARVERLLQQVEGGPGLPGARESAGFV